MIEDDVNPKQKIHIYTKSSLSLLSHSITLKRVKV